MYQAFMPVAATTILGVVMFRWATEEMRQQGRLSQGATAGVAALVGLHALIVITASAGGAGVVDVSREVTRDVGLPLLVVGAVLTIAALSALRSTEFLSGVRPPGSAGRGVYRWGRHPLYLGWAAMLLGVAILGASALAAVLVLLQACALGLVARGENRRFEDEAAHDARHGVLRLAFGAVAGLAIALMLVACGGSRTSSGETSSEGPAARDLRAQLGAATNPDTVRFPAVNGRSLQEVGDAIGNVGPQAALATSVFRPGENRLAFGLIDRETGFVYGPSAVYVAAKPSATARGPYPAPADLLVTEAPYRSRQAATEKDPFAAIYSATVPLRRPGATTVLVMTRLGKRFVVAPTTIEVSSAQADRVPDVGEPAPRVHTDTIASAKGDLESIDTRVPTDSMHRVDFADVVGRKPTALLFATPQLCESRVCGPVTDLAEQLKARYGDEMEFIHQEVFVDNDPSKGLRPSLKAFNLTTEPWLFVVDARGRVAARLQGSFGLSAFEAAIRKGLES